MKMFGLTQEKVAQKVGKSRPAIANTVRLLNLPAEIQRAIIENKISEGHARAILGLTGTERQLALYKMIVDQGLNVRQVEAKVRELWRALAWKRQALTLARWLWKQSCATN
jgi:ParB family chromosome partitioning protein